MLAGGALAASTKSYSFLGNILRPNPDQIIWTPMGIMGLHRIWIGYDDKGKLHALKIKVMDETKNLWVDKIQYKVTPWGVPSREFMENMVKM